MAVVPYRHKVQYYETDMMGVAHHSNYIRWFEECRIDYMEQLGYRYQEVEKQGVEFPVLGVSCNYKSSVCFGEVVQIQSWFSLLTTTRMSFNYRVTDMDSGKLRATGESRHCYCRITDHKPVQLNKTLPDLYVLFNTWVENEQKKN
jgi:acyl-CoA thioester hydrolase